MRDDVEKDIALGQRGKVKGFIPTDEFGVPYDQYVSETPHVESEALAIGRQLGNHRGYMVNIDPDDAFLEANRPNGVDLTIYSVDRRCEGIFNRVGWEEISWNLRDPTLDAFSQLRSGYKGGNIPSLLKSCNPCSRVNPKDVAKRMAKNKVTRKTKRK